MGIDGEGLHPDDARVGKPGKIGAPESCTPPLSPSADRDLLRRACSTGCFGFLVKPLRSIEIRAAIHIALQQHSAAMRAFARHSWLTTMLAPGISSAHATAGQSLGLLSMQERARFIGGRLQLKASDGDGTVIDVMVPLGNPDEAKTDPNRRRSPDDAGRNRAGSKVRA
jgi:signal transduction histidine kinase